ncbi:MAG: biotin/lipoyl-binding protein, partial [Streptosporangiaceae bacterium]
HTPQWRLLIAPFAGTFHAEDMPAGETVRAGAVIGRVTSRRDEHLITAPCDGSVVEWLAEDGDPVSAGQSLTRLDPEVVPA